MDKYGVDTDVSDNEKTAQDKPPKCPVCDKELEDPANTGQRKCPVHGTEPFEK
jgi:hypothetical protein